MSHSLVRASVVGATGTVSAALFVFLLLPAGGAGAPVALCSSEMYLATSVTQGPVPLLVSFSLEVNWSSTPAVNWSFGDGSPSLVGTGPAFLHPSHRYGIVGSYPATVKVSSGIRSGSCAVVIDVQPPALTVTASAHPITTVAPATITFTGSATGGTNTYTSELWSFSDGTATAGWNTTHAFETPGAYSGTLTVVDSQGDAAHASVFVNVSAAVLAHPVSAPASVDPLSVAAGAGAAVIGAALLYVGGSGAAVASARPESENRPEETEEFDSDDTGPLLPEGFAYRGHEPAAHDSLFLEHVPPDPDLPMRPLPAPTITELALLGALPALPAPVLPVEVPAIPGAPTAEPADAEVREANDLRLSQRVLLHLYGQGRLADDEVATPGFTQAGMTGALSTQQSLLSNVLRRMLYSGFLSQDVRHVRGASRRLRVYRLTTKGERVARQLMERIGKGS
ncbi:MAG: PKD domain-containing protein [Thermoplasmata archaeon]|nr:PKD domain-containing protein [Thermoplasmata archaeon]